MKIAACQTPEFIGDINASLSCIESFSIDVEKHNIDLLLFPECFLQGYLVNDEHLEQYALDLTSSEFKVIMKRLSDIKMTLIFGVIERSEGKFYNSAVVLKNGTLLGVYRKKHLLGGEALFEPGLTSPVFELKGIKYGINICSDTQFPDSAKAIAEQGASVMLVPAQNMMKQEAAEVWKYKHNEIRAERAKENHMWVISADVTGRRDELRIGYGPTAVINPEGEVVAQVPLMETGVVVAEILDF